MLFISTVQLQQRFFNSLITLIKLLMTNHYNLANFRNNLISKNHPLDPIFVPTFRQTMEQNYQLSLKQNKHYQKKSSLSFCEYSHQTSNIQIYKNTFFVKQDMRPHENRPLKFKISQLIKSSLAHCKTLANIQQKSQVQSANITKNKKSTSYSAYINSHKKILQKKNSLDIQKESSFISLKLSSNSHKIKEQKTQAQMVEKLQRDKLENTNEKKEIRIVETEIKESKQKYLQRLILKNKKTQIARRQRLNMFSPKFEGEFKAEALKNGILKLVRKRRNQPSLIVNTKKKKLKYELKQEKQDSLQKVYKRFADQKSLDEEDLEFIIKKQELKIQKKQLENSISQQFFSKAITILQIRQGQINSLFSLNQKRKLQIASVTKIMTCYLILLLFQNFNLDLKKQKVIISQRASKMQGTSAKLSYSDVVNIYDLLHGLMLPSGNDAAIALGEWGGKIIRKYSSILKRQQTSLSPSPPKLQKNLNGLVTKRKSNLKLFIYHMNKLAKQLNLNKTYFMNTHGLMNDKAYSCSEDVSVLSYYSMKNTIFRDIVGKRDYSCKIYNRTFSITKDFKWKNTNKLLSVQGFKGIKTGVTPSAGPCLTSMFQLQPDHYFIVTILHTKSCQMRFTETIKLLQNMFEFLKENKDQRQLFQNAISNLYLYQKDQSKEYDGQMLNNMLQSTSQSEKDQDQQI